MKNELHQRMIDFSSQIIHLKLHLVPGFESTHLYQQLFRSSSSIPLNYAESLAGESMKDFVHKMMICLKELHESKTNLLLIQKGNLLKNPEYAHTLINESNQLISLLTKSINTCKTKYPEKFNN